MIKWLAVLLAVPAIAVACPPGYVPTDVAGVCQESDVPEHPDWVSDEKPPEDKMPSYQREGVVVINALPGVEPSTSTAHDYRAEREQK